MLTRRVMAAGGVAAGGMAALARPALAEGRSKTLRFVPQADLAGLDPVWTTAYVVRNHGYMVYDTLYSLTAAFEVRPQMVAGHEVSDDGLRWALRLRDGLRFHDGTPVRGRDCAASIRRWGARNGMGQTLLAQTDELSAPDDHTIVFRLRRPFPLLPLALGSLAGPVPFMMPERLAATDPMQAVREAVGSGPFRFLPSEWQAGSRAVWARFDGYVPRDEPPDGLAGGKVARIDRVEWQTIPDSATAIAALQRDEVDWVEVPPVDLMGEARKQRDIIASTLDPIGTYALLRFNALFPPFDDVLARRAVLHAVRQRDYMQADVGDNGQYEECRAFFPCHTPFSTGAGNQAMDGDMDAARALLKASRYDGRTVVVLSPADVPHLTALGYVTADLLQKLGMRVNLVMTDWPSIVARRASQKAPEEGGWNIFHTTAVAPEFMSPGSHLALRGNGREGWAGWFTSTKMEALRADWFDAPDESAQRRAAAAMEQEAFDQVPYVPLGQFQQPTLFRRRVRNVVQATAPLFWGLSLES